MSIYVASADGFTFRESWIGSIVVRLYDGVYHAELFTCTPGSFEGIEWTKEELEATRVCLEDSAAWMAERCRWAGLNWAMKHWIGSKNHATIHMPLYSWRLNTFFRRCQMTVLLLFHSRWLLIAGAVLNRWARAKQALRLRPAVWECWAVGRLRHFMLWLTWFHPTFIRVVSSLLQNPNGYLSLKHVGTWPNLPRFSSKWRATPRKVRWNMDRLQGRGKTCGIVSGLRWWGLTLDTGLKEGEGYHFSRHPGPDRSVSWRHGSRDKSLGRMPPPLDCLRIQACANKDKRCSR